MYRPCAKANDGMHRRSLRLPGFDYTQSGAYFVTLCTQGNRRLLGEVTDGCMVPNTFGVTALDCWRELPSHYPNLALDAFVLMQNHVHGILLIEQNALHGLPEIVRAFETFSARRINSFRATPARRYGSVPTMSASSVTKTSSIRSATTSRTIQHTGCRSGFQTRPPRTTRNAACLQNILRPPNQLLESDARPDGMAAFLL
jgi:REP element-mobilizing transposase RayT